jgi:hypothetical protein
MIILQPPIEKAYDQRPQKAFAFPLDEISHAIADDVHLRNPTARPIAHAE